MPFRLMPSNETEICEIEQSLFSKAKFKVYKLTRKVNHTVLHRAWTLYYITTGLLLGTLTIGLIVSIFVTFKMAQTSELGFVLVCFILELIYIVGHVNITWFRTYALCFTGMMINFGICLYMIVFMILVIVQTRGFNPLKSLMGFAFILTVLHGLSYLADLNLLRFLHFKQNHWLGKLFFGGFDCKNKTAETSLNESELPKYSKVGKKSSIITTSGEIKAANIFSQDQRISAGDDAIQAVSNYLDKNPFADSDAILPSTMPSHLTQTNPFDMEYALSGVLSNEPASEYLIDCQNIIPKPTQVFTDLNWSEFRYFGGNQTASVLPIVQTSMRDQTKQMEYAAEVENQWTTSANSMPPQAYSNAVHLFPSPHPSVLAQKSVLPVPEYIERADFISRLQETAFY